MSEKQNVMKVSSSFMTQFCHTVHPNIMCSVYRYGFECIFNCRCADAQPIQKSALQNSINTDTRLTTSWHKQHQNAWMETLVHTPIQMFSFSFFIAKGKLHKTKPHQFPLLAVLTHHGLEADSCYFCVHTRQDVPIFNFKKKHTSRYLTHNTNQSCSSIRCSIWRRGITLDFTKLSIF